MEVLMPGCHSNYCNSFYSLSVQLLHWDSNQAEKGCLHKRSFHFNLLQNLNTENPYVLVLTFK